MAFHITGHQGQHMSVLKKQRIDLRLTDDDKSIIEEAAAMSNQSITRLRG